MCKCQKHHLVGVLIYIFLSDKRILIFGNRYREALYTRLLPVDNTRWLKCFLKVVKLWTKEIRFKSSPAYVNLMLTDSYILSVL